MDTRLRSTRTKGRHSRLQSQTTTEKASGPCPELRAHLGLQGSAECWGIGILAPFPCACTCFKFTTLHLRGSVRRVTPSCRSSCPLSLPRRWSPTGTTHVPASAGFHPRPPCVVAPALSVNLGPQGLSDREHGASRPDGQDETRSFERGALFDGRGDCSVRETTLKDVAASKQVGTQVRRASTAVQPRNVLCSPRWTTRAKTRS